MTIVALKRPGTPLLLALLLLFLWAAAGFWAISGRQQAITAREVELARLNVAVEQQTLRLLKLAEATVVTMAAWIEVHPRAYLGGDPAFDAMVERLTRFSDNVFEIRIIDEQGGAYIVPSRKGMPVTNLAEREHFRVQQDEKTRGLFVSDPVFSLVNAKWVVPVSYPAIKTDGKVITVVSSIQLERIAALFEVQRHKPGGSITLIKTNGVTLFRVPPVDGVIGKSIAGAPDFIAHLNVKDRGQYQIQGAYDQRQRLVSHSRLKDYPVIIAVTLDLDDALLPWRYEMYRFFGVLLIVSIVTVLFAIRFRRAENAARQKLEKSEKRFRELIEHAPEAIVVYDVDAKRIVDANPQAEKLFGCSHRELLSDGIERFYASVQSGGVPAGEAIEDAVLRAFSGESVVDERLLRRASGVDVTVEVRVEDMSENGRRLVRSSYYNITERKRAEAQLRESELRWKFALEGAGVGVWDWNIQTGEATLSTRWKAMLGYTESEIGNNAEEWSSRVHPDDLPGVMAAIQAHMEGKTPNSSSEFRMRCKDGHWIWTLGRGMVVSCCADGKPLRLVGTQEDITERKQLEEQIRQLAYFDVLTSLPNRRMLDDRLNHDMAASKRSGLYGALMYLDLDNFKQLNDTHGHGVGDLLLIEVAKRLAACVREVDTVARLGGDEFVVMLSDLGTDKAQSREQAAGVAEKIRASLAAPYLLAVTQSGNQVATVEHHCSTSIGVVLFVNHDASPADVLKWADAAMYQAKDAGRNAIRFYQGT
jgi:diguanylate cyclase (GGDEF)-like protein/PAS domain S-box-containing protein